MALAALAWWARDPQRLEATWARNRQRLAAPCLPEDSSAEGPSQARMPQHWPQARMPQHCRTGHLSQAREPQRCFELPKVRRRRRHVEALVRL